MRTRKLVAAIATTIVLGACSSSSNSPRAVDSPPVNNDSGDPVTGIITANFAPSAGVVPFPTNLLLSGTTDLTLNIPVADPTDISNPAVAMNALDGFSTVARWATNFSTTINPSTVVPGSSVRLFEVALNQPGGAVVGVVRELTPGAEYVAVASGSTLAILPTAPLAELTTYMAVLTDDIQDNDGNDSTPDQQYFIAKRTDPLVDANGNSTDPLLDNATASALEPLRQLTNAQEFAAASMGIPREEIVLSWTATTQAVTPVLSAVRSVTGAGASAVGPTGLTTAALGLAGAANISVGTVEVPYYLDAPSASNPTAILTGRWEASPGAYVAPFDALGLDPTSTNVTYANPFPVAKSTQTIPVLVTTPSDATGITKPPSGWPVMIFQHGITGNRTQALAIADAAAAAGFAVISIDIPLHGLTDTTNPLYAGPIERTFNVDLIDNATSAPGPDGNIDGSGAHFINLQSLVTSRDNLRQASADLMTLAATIPGMDMNGDSLPDFDGARIHYTGLSLGSIIGTVFTANEPTVNVATLSVPGGGIPRLLEASDTFGPVIRAGLGAAGVEPGTADFEQFLIAAQTTVDSADPINYGAITTATNAIMLQEVIGDTVIPNFVATAPLAGTEPLINVMGLNYISETTVDPGGIRGFNRILNASHGSLLDPTANLEATVEMQGEAVSMAASDGVSVVVTNPQVIAPPQ